MLLVCVVMCVYVDGWCCDVCVWVWISMLVCVEWCVYYWFDVMCVVSMCGCVGIYVVV